MVSHKEKLKFIEEWASNNGLNLVLDGTCGFGRECVGVIINDTYPDYVWYNDDYEREDSNGDVWVPPNAYHKHPCVAVLGRGESAESQLYEWLKWFDNNNFKVETGYCEGVFDEVQILFGKHRYARMVKFNNNKE